MSKRGTYTALICGGVFAFGLLLGRGLTSDVAPVPYSESKRAAVDGLGEDVVPASASRHLLPRGARLPGPEIDPEGVVKSGRPLTHHFDHDSLVTAAPPSRVQTNADADLGDVVRSDLEAVKALQELQSPQPTPPLAAIAESEPVAELFSSQELAQLRQTADPETSDVWDPEGIIPGAHNGFMNVEAPALEAAPIETTPTPTPSPSTGATWTGQPRGYAMYYMMHPNARVTAERELQIIIAAGVREVFLGVLTDGTFGKDFEYLAQVLRRLHAAQRVTTLALYLTNGATMRNYKNTDITAGFNTINPSDFRSLIRWDSATRARFTAMVKEVRPLYELNRSLHPENHNIAVVMLEDNLQADSYVAMRALAAAVVGDLVQFVRNPCPGCYAGNDSAGMGDAIEIHNPRALPQLSPRDGLTLDGTSFYFPWEIPVPKALSVEQTMEMGRLAYAIGVSYVGLWRAERQGIVNNQIVHPDKRIFEVPTMEQAQIELQLLREGLENAAPIDGPQEPIPVEE